MIRATGVYRFCDKATEGLFYFMAVFSPWAFGTTQPWSIWTMNVCGFLVGLLFFCKWVIRRQRSKSIDGPSDEKIKVDFGFGHFLNVALQILTVVILLYCVIAALNAHATYDPFTKEFIYYSCIEWLPHSYDKASTWQAFWNYLALALIFWGFHDWLFSKNEGKEENRRAMPPRLRRLLWVLCLNGTLVVVQGILQRAGNSSKLLWLVEPTFYPGAQNHFGPFAYRANAAQYFNLLWPVALGFWWTLHRAGSARNSHHLLLPCIFLIATGALISLSRGAAIITALCAVAATMVLMVAQRRDNLWMRFGLPLLLLAVFAFAAYFNGDKLIARFKQASTDKLGGRFEIYERAKKMADDFPLFGTGPNTFGTVSRLYLSEDQTWFVQVHNDWLETRVTFGWLGFSLILTALVIVIVRCLFAGGMYSHWSSIAFLGIAIGGCLVHARFDFPLQIYSVLFLFVMTCSMLFSSTKKK